jgi:glycosyltransferase involved in cell wall biosynthesis
MKEIFIYITTVCLILNFIFGKLKLLAIVWLYNTQRKQNEPTISISVIICSRNDLNNLQHNLNTILEQDYHSFEVIVVNDASQDGTTEYLEKVSKEKAKLKIVNIQKKESSGKKQALKMGIENAQYPFILLSDADCMADTNQWIKSHAQFANEKNTLLLGYGKYKKEKGFLNALIRFDTVTIAVQYMSRALWKYPYMGVGRNMGYSKELNTGLSSINTTIASGDDDLFVQAISKGSVIIVNAEKESFTTSIAKPTWKEWFDQKGRHTTTAPYYSIFTKIWLMVQWMVSVGFYLGFIIILLTGDIRTGVILFMLNMLSIGLFNGLWIRKLGEKDLILLSPILDIIYTFVQPIFVIKSWGRNKQQWN